MADRLRRPVGRARRSTELRPGTPLRVPAELGTAEAVSGFRPSSAWSARAWGRTAGDQLTAAAAVDAPAEAGLSRSPDTPQQPGERRLNLDSIGLKEDGD